MNGVKRCAICGRVLSERNTYETMGGKVVCLDATSCSDTRQARAELLRLKEPALGAKIRFFS